MPIRCLSDGSSDYGVSTLLTQYNIILSARGPAASVLIIHDMYVCSTNREISHMLTCNIVIMHHCIKQQCHASCTICIVVGVCVNVMCTIFYVYLQHFMFTFPFTRVM